MTRDSGFVVSMQWWIEVQLGNKCAITWRISVIIMANVEDNYRYVALRTFILFQTFLISRRMYADTKFRDCKEEKNTFDKYLSSFFTPIWLIDAIQQLVSSLFKISFNIQLFAYPFKATLPLTIIYSPSIWNCSKGESLLSLKSSINGIQ